MELRGADGSVVVVYNKQTGEVRWVWPKDKYNNDVYIKQEEKERQRPVICKNLCSLQRYG